MNTDPADSEPDAPDAPDAIPAAQDDPSETTAPGSAGRRTAPLDDYKRQHHGRRYMDAWMLHQAFMVDFAEELAADATPATPPAALETAPPPEPPPPSED